MDMRTGKLYESEEAARAAGVPEQFVAQVSPYTRAGKTIIDVVEVRTGPFRGRIYERGPAGLIRRRDLERQARLQKGARR